jgi:uncharacterized protein (TIGR00645 family)
MAKYFGGCHLLARTVAQILFYSRWLLTPFYVALIVALLALLGRDVLSAYDLAVRFRSMEADDVILAALGLVDLTLTASLVVLVIFSCYANFVARIDLESHEDWPHWMVEIDFSELKLKLLGSLVAISGVKLLETYMDIDHESDRALAWNAGIFGVFVAGMLFSAIAEGVSRHFEQKHD